jgi:SAM-dependent methyltransferase
VIGLDISAGNLEICRAYLQQTGKSNAEARLIHSLMDFEELPACDVFFSLIVLQHNPPPIIKYILDKCLAAVRPGGIAYFQVPTSPVGYSFKVDHYLASNAPEMEMHALPMHQVFRWRRSMPPLPVR